MNGINLYVAAMPMPSHQGSPMCAPLTPTNAIGGLTALRLINLQQKVDTVNSSTTCTSITVRLLSTI